MKSDVKKKYFALLLMHPGDVQLCLTVCFEPSYGVKNKEDGRLLDFL